MADEIATAYVKIDLDPNGFDSKVQQMLAAAPDELDITANIKADRAALVAAVNNIRDAVTAPREGGGLEARVLTAVDLSGLLKGMGEVSALAEKATKPITVDVEGDTSPLVEKVKEAYRAISQYKLDKVNLQLDLEHSDALSAHLKAIDDQISLINAHIARIKLAVDEDEALTILEQLAERRMALGKLMEKTMAVNIDTDFAREELGLLQAAADELKSELSDMQAGITILDPARVTQIQHLLRTYSTGRAEIINAFGTGEAEATVGKLMDRIQQVTERDYSIASTVEFGPFQSELLPPQALPNLTKYLESLIAVDKQLEFGPHLSEIAQPSPNFIRYLESLIAVTPSMDQAADALKNYAKQAASLKVAETALKLAPPTAETKAELASISAQLKTLTAGTHEIRVNLDAPNAAIANLERNLAAVQSMDFTVPAAAGAAAGGGKGGGFWGGLLGALGFGGGGGRGLGRFGLGALGGLAAFGSIASFAGLGAEHLLLTGLGIAGSAVGGLLGGGLLGLGAGSVALTGAATDLAGAGQALGDARKVSSAMTSLSQAVGRYGAASRQAAQASSSLAFTIQQVPTVAQGAVVALANAAQATHQLFNAATGNAERLGAGLLTQLLSIADTYLPAIGKYAAENTAIITRSIQPLFSFLRGAGGHGIFTDLENQFQSTLPTAVHAFTQAFELFLKIIDTTSGYVGHLIGYLDQLFTRLNSPAGFAQVQGVIGHLIDDFHLWWDFVKALGSALFTLFNRDAGTARAIIQYLTYLLTQVTAYMRTTAGTNAVHNIFQVHKDEILALLQVAVELAKVFAGIYLALTPTLVRAVTALANAVAHVISFLQAVSPFTRFIADWSIGLLILRGRFFGVAEGIKLVVLALKGLLIDKSLLSFGAVTALFSKAGTKAATVNDVKQIVAAGGKDAAVAEATTVGLLGVNIKRLGSVFDTAKGAVAGLLDKLDGIAPELRIAIAEAQAFALTLSELAIPAALAVALGELVNQLDKTKGYTPVTTGHVGPIPITQGQYNPKTNSYVLFPLFDKARHDFAAASNALSHGLDVLGGWISSPFIPSSLATRSVPGPLAPLAQRFPGPLVDTGAGNEIHPRNDAQRARTIAYNAYLQSLTPAGQRLIAFTNAIDQVGIHLQAQAGQFVNASNKAKTYAGTLGALTHGNQVLISSAQKSAVEINKVLGKGIDVNYLDQIVKNDPAKLAMLAGLSKHQIYKINVAFEINAFEAAHAGQTGTKAYTAAIIKALGDANPSIRAAARDILRNLPGVEKQIPPPLLGKYMGAWAQAMDQIARTVHTGMTKVEKILGQPNASASATARRYGEAYRSFALNRQNEGSGGNIPYTKALADPFTKVVSGAHDATNAVKGTTDKVMGLGSHLAALQAQTTTGVGAITRQGSTAHTTVTGVQTVTGTLGTHLSNLQGQTTTGVGAIIRQGSTAHTTVTGITTATSTLASSGVRNLTTFAGGFAAAIRNAQNLSNIISHMPTAPSLPSGGSSPPTQHPRISRADGGWIPGHGAVPIIAHGGEYVLSQDNVASIMKGETRGHTGPAFHADAVNIYNPVDLEALMQKTEFAVLSREL